MVYRDEPIIMTASQMKNYTPPKYREMKAILRDKNVMYVSDIEIFKRQARFMEDFEDDYAYVVPFVGYYPTYRSLSNEQLRTYFTWRAKFRRGEVMEVPSSYIFVHIYELLNSIGGQNPADCLRQLRRIYDSYGERREIGKYLERWMTDYAVFHALPAELIRDYCGGAFDDALVQLMHCEEADDAALFTAVTELSSYQIANSKLYKSYPGETAKAVCGTVRQMSAYYAAHRKKTYVQKLFGLPTNLPYPLFDGAIFSGRNKHADCSYEVSPVQRYLCQNGRWFCEKAYGKPHKSTELGVLVKAVDSALRVRVGLPALTLSVAPTKVLTDMIDRELAGLYQLDLADGRRGMRGRKKAAAQEEAPKPQPVTFDFSKLDTIRRAADETAMKLMTAEERGDTLPSCPVATDAGKTEVKEEVLTESTPAAPADTDAGGILTDTERDVLRLILQGEDVAGYCRAQHLMLSLVVDGINEKMMDEIGDTVLEFDGDTAVPIEDYIEDMQAYL